MAAADLLSATDSTPEILRKLEARGYLAQTKRLPAQESTTLAPRAGPTLNDAQREAVERISGTLGSFASHLLYGVTGSGKTEVYLRTIAAVIERNEQALVLVPEIALTPQLIARFRARFDTPLAVLHSNLSDGERLAAWRSAGDGRARIVIGTRSAVFSPLARAGLIVVDEEHDALVQAAGRVPLLRARPGDRARATPRHSDSARLGHAIAGDLAPVAAPAAVAVASAAACGQRAAAAHGADRPARTRRNAGNRDARR